MTICNMSWRRRSMNVSRLKITKWRGRYDDRFPNENDNENLQQYFLIGNTIKINDDDF